MINRNQRMKKYASLNEEEMFNKNTFDCLVRGEKAEDDYLSKVFFYNDGKEFIRARQFKVYTNRDIDIENIDELAFNKKFCQEIANGISLHNYSGICWLNEYLYEFLTAENISCMVQLKKYLINLDQTEVENFKTNHTFLYILMQCAYDQYKVMYTLVDNGYYLKYKEFVEDKNNEDKSFKSWFNSYKDNIRDEKRRGWIEYVINEASIAGEEVNEQLELELKGAWAACCKQYSGGQKLARLLSKESDYYYLMHPAELRGVIDGKGLERLDRARKRTTSSHPAQKTEFKNAKLDKRYVNIDSGKIKNNYDKNEVTYLLDKDVRDMIFD